MRKNNSTTDNFFAVQKEKSKIKTLIVTEFFKAYFPIINSVFKKDVWYIDLFCGPGRYDDGNPSTPIVLLDVVERFKSDDIRQKLRIVFNDHDAKLVEKLRNNLSGHPVLSKLKYQPEILNLKAADIDLSLYTQGQNPIFSFVDPWGYKDVSAAQVWKLVKNIGSDCVLFFNSDRILQDINKPANKSDFEEIFGKNFDRARAIQTDTQLSQRQKAEQFLSLFSQNLYDTVWVENNKKVKLFILPFYIEADDKEKTSHYIVFISKSHKAIQEMRRVMIKLGNSTSAMLGYDSKDEMQISLLSRNDDLANSIIPVIKATFLNYPALFNKIHTIDGLSEWLDRYSMSTTYKVLPYNRQELKSVVEELYHSGYIEIAEPLSAKMRKPITYDRKFRVRQTIEGV